MKVENPNLQAYIENLQSQGRYCFSRKEAVQALKLTEIAFRLAVSRLAKKIKVARIYGDFYIIIPLEYKEIGCLPAPWFIDDLMRYLKIDYYVGLLSAAALHGAAHQQPMVFQVITNKVLNPIKAGRLRIEFHYKKKIDPAISQPTKTETGTMRVSNPEMTAYDIVKYIDAAGQINNVTTVLQELQEKINTKIFSQYAEQNFFEVSVVQRLGFLLEYLFPNLDLNKLADWVKQKKPRYRLLVAGSSAPILERNKRWCILINETIEQDL